MMQLQVEVLPLGLLPPVLVLVLVHASVLLPVVLPEPQLLLVPQPVPVLDSEPE